MGGGSLFVVAVTHYELHAPPPLRSSGVNGSTTSSITEAISNVARRVLVELPPLATRFAAGAKVTTIPSSGPRLQFGSATPPGAELSSTRYGQVFAARIQGPTY